MEQKKTKFKKVEIYVASNGYSVCFKEYIGSPSSKDWFVAKTLTEVRQLCDANLVSPKDY